MQNNRDYFLDFIRGSAVLMMFVFHLIYNLNYFQFTNIPLFDNPYFIFWRYVIVTIFLLAVGISITYAYQHNFDRNKFIKRLLGLGLAASIISIISWFFAHEQWIYFGILHLIWCSYLIAVLFRNHPKIALISGSLILFLGIFNIPDLTFLEVLLVDFIPSSTLDFYPLFPWLGLVLIGIYIPNLRLYQSLNFNLKPINFLGKNALFFYLIHQLILFPLIAFFALLTSWIL